MNPAERMSPAEMLAELHAITRDDQADNRERVPYDGPEPTEPWLSPRDMDVAALRDEDRTERQWRWFER